MSAVQNTTVIAKLPFMVQYGVTLLQVLSALQVLVKFADIVYPVLQLNEATD